MPFGLDHIEVSGTVDRIEDDTAFVTFEGDRSGVQRTVECRILNHIGVGVGDTFRLVEAETGSTPDVWFEAGSGNQSDLIEQIGKNRIWGLLNDQSYVGVAN